MDKQTFIEAYPESLSFRAISKDPEDKTVRRCFRTGEDSIFIYAKGKSRYGHYWGIEPFLRNFDILPDKDENEEWHKRLRSAVKRLDQSGMWPELRERFANLLQMTLEDKKALYEIFQSRHCLDKGVWRMKTAEEMDALYAPYVEKYPFAFVPSENGDNPLAESGSKGKLHWALDTGYVYELSECKLKTMYFGVHNKIIKAELKKAIANKNPYSTRQRTSYDVSATYDPHLRKGWYSEEYKDCGNGHYYLMLDHSAAVFCEND